MTEQRSYFSRGCVRELPGLLAEYDADSVLLVCGRKSFETSGLEPIITAALSGCRLCRFSDFSANPTLQESLAGARLAQAQQCSLIIAAGGGSAMDVAKTISAFLAMPGNESELVEGQVALQQPTLPVIAIPTTAGTGSECTSFAVVYIGQQKYSLADDALLPDACLCDPSLTDSLPPAVTASTGFDALCQSIESFWAAAATQQSMDYAREAIPLIMHHLPTAVNEPTDEDRDAMLWAAHLAGKAINITKTTAPHALSYRISSLFGTPHGHAVALSLGAFFSWHEREDIEFSDSMTTDQFKVRHLELLSMMGASDGQQASDNWYDLMRTCGLSLQLEGSSVPRSPYLDEIIASVNLQRLANHPIKLDSAELKNILTSIPAV